MCTSHAPSMAAITRSAVASPSARTVAAGYCAGQGRDLGVAGEQPRAADQHDPVLAPGGRRAGPAATRMPTASRRWAGPAATASCPRARRAASRSALRPAARRRSSRTESPSRLDLQAAADLGQVEPVGAAARRPRGAARTARGPARGSAAWVGPTCTRCSRSPVTTTACSWPSTSVSSSRSVSPSWSSRSAVRKASAWPGRHRRGVQDALADGGLEPAALPLERGRRGPAVQGAVQAGRDVAQGGQVGHQVAVGGRADRGDPQQGAAPAFAPLQEQPGVRPRRTACRRAMSGQRGAVGGGQACAARWRRESAGAGRAGPGRGRTRPACPASAPRPRTRSPGPASRRCGCAAGPGAGRRPPYRRWRAASSRRPAPAPSGR